ncbi:MAG TPA: hypothetical protein VN223_04390, partial [Candidatus Elarobacter sp.]|nr:hypothetical protein [Candidatus Elarobacter sp.]
KAIVSLIICGLAIFVLVVMWVPTPVPSVRETAVIDILANCYRRALFTRMHAQLSTKAMMASIDGCRETIESNIPKIHRKDLQSIAVELLGTVEAILRKNPDSAEDWPAINALKLKSLEAFKKLADATGGNYPLPDRGKLAASAYFTNEEAEKPPSLEDIKAGNESDSNHK